MTEPDEPTNSNSSTHRLPAGTALAPIAFGELIDKISILEIKSDRIADPAKNSNVRRELEVMNGVLAHFAPARGFADLKAELRRINEALWDLEDEIRKYEREKDFGPLFIEAARGIFKTNDRRAAVKRELNELAGSSLLEEKSYEDF